MLGWRPMARPKFCTWRYDRGLVGSNTPKSRIGAGAAWAGFAAAGRAEVADVAPAAAEVAQAAMAMVAATTTVIGTRRIFTACLPMRCSLPVIPQSGPQRADRSRVIADTPVLVVHSDVLVFVKPDESQRPPLADSGQQV